MSDVPSEEPIPGEAGAGATGDAPPGGEPLTVDDVLAGGDGGPGGAEAPPAPAPEDEVTAARRQRDEYLSALQHLQADFENYRKRMAKQAAETSERATETLVAKLLPVLDVADLAVAHGAGEEVKQIWTALLDALEREGLERIEGLGGPFDPTRQDAVAHEPGDGAQEVAEVLRAGYAWKGRVLRAAMVKVRG